MVTLGVAALVAISARDDGAYYVDAWAPLGLALLATLVFALVVLRRSPALIPSIGGVALLALGGWAVLSTQWGGLPNEAWTMLDQSFVGSAALLAGSALVGDARDRFGVYAGVFLGLTANTIEILIRAASSGGPAGWFFGRYLEGPAGYHNAQAMLFVLGLPLALGAATSSKVYVRACGGAASGLFLGALILTQSRGGLLAAAIATIVLLAWARDLSLLLFSAPTLVATAGLLIALRPVDAALASGSAAHHVDELRRYVIWCSVSALTLASVAAVSTHSRRGLVAAFAIAGVALAFSLAAGVEKRASVEHAVHRVTSSAGSASPDTAPPGTTRLASLSLNGRLDAWRVAWTMVKDRPLLGAGQGQFSRRWGISRPTRARYLYIIQPHSIELELLSELGAIGLGLFALFFGSAVVSAGRARGRIFAAIALAMLAGLLAESTVDWTWSFPAVVVPAMLAAGAAFGGRRVGRLRLAVPLAAPVLIAAAILLAGPYLSDRQLDRGRAQIPKDLDTAWTLALAAHTLNPWDGRVLVLEGQVQEAAGRYLIAAREYQKSAKLIRRPWVSYFREARAFEEAGARAQLRRACKRAFAANPLEPLLHYGPCRHVS